MSLAAGGVSRAAPPPAQEEAARLEAQGEAAADAGHLSEASDAWRKAWVHRPDDPRLACNIGRCELRRSDYREASLWLTRCVRLYENATNPKEIELRKQYTLELLTAMQRVSSLTVDVDEPDTRVVIDDDIIRVWALGAPSLERA